MYACVCKAVTEQQIHDELDGGACNLKALQTRLGVGTQCGKCCSGIRRMVLERVQDEPRRAPLNIPSIDGPLPA